MASSRDRTTALRRPWAQAACGCSTGTRTGTRRASTYESFKLSAASAEVFDALAGRVGAVISGRRTYEITDGWGGDGPLPGAPLFVLTHQIPEHVPHGNSAYTFVTDGIESAIEQARAAAGGKDVSLMGSAAVQQALRAGLLDEIGIHLIPVLLGGGMRLLDHLGDEPVELERIEIVDAPGVTHLRYRVVR
jgi:dihydrofolate reductase